MKKARIWELDALRGLCILAVVAVHLMYDLVEICGLFRWDAPGWFDFLKNWGGTAFFLLSGISATLGSRSFRRGLAVFFCGLLCTGVTWGIFRLGFWEKSMVIWFGALHCLGLCMMLWEGFRRLPRYLTAFLCLAFLALGLYWQLSGIRSSCSFLVPLGLMTPGFSSPDYFPLLPFLGFFLLGTLAGGLLYPKKQSLLPQSWGHRFRFLQWCGRQSLLIYLLHQPVLMAVCMGIPRSLL